MAAASDEKSTERSIFRLFEHEDGEVNSRSSPTVKTIVFKYRDDSETRFDLAKAFNGTLPPPSVGRAAAAFGIATSAGNAGNTFAFQRKKAGTDFEPADIREVVEGRLEDLVPEDGSEGDWSSERAPGGPRTSTMLEAILEYRQAQKADVSPERMQAFRELLKTDDSAVKRFMADPDFRKVYERRKMEKALAKTGAKAADLLS